MPETEGEHGPVAIGPAVAGGRSEQPSHLCFGEMLAALSRPRPARKVKPSIATNKRALTPR
jgi:hypothetical protein